MAAASRSVLTAPRFLWRPDHKWLLSTHLLLCLEDFLLKSVKSWALILAALLKNVWSRAVTSQTAWVLGLVYVVPCCSLLLDVLLSVNITRESHTFFSWIHRVTSTLISKRVSKQSKERSGKKYHRILKGKRKRCDLKHWELVGSSVKTLPNQKVLLSIKLTVANRYKINHWLA